jgi:hypothetical protein
VFIRFFRNAVFQSGPYHKFLDSSTFDNLKYGKWGCYTFSKKKLLIIETPKKFEMDARWTYFYFQVMPERLDAIYTHNTTFTFGSSPSYIEPPWVYRKVKPILAEFTVRWGE